MTRAPRRPQSFRLPQDATDDAEREAAARAAGIVLTPDPQDFAAETAPPAAPAVRPRRGSGLAALFWSALGGLVTLMIGVAVASFIEDLFARAPWLGWLGVALAVLLAVAVLGIGMREWLALRRLAVIDRLRERAEVARAADDRDAARGIVKELDALYAGVPETARDRAAMRAHAAAIVDGADLLALAEHELLAPLDAKAAALVAEAARRVSLVTAVAPRALLDIATVAINAAALIRGIAAIYGVRPGKLGFLKLARHVLGHLAVTGGMVAGEGLVEQLVGHGIAARLSAKLGEGVVNGLLTARLGLAAIAVCRPLAFVAQRPPTLRQVAGGLFASGG